MNYNSCCFFEEKKIKICLIALFINVLGRIISIYLQLPVFLDSIGTIFLAIAYGPIEGGLIGLMTNGILTLFIVQGNFYYGIINFIIGVVTGIAAKTNYFQNLGRVLFAGFYLAIVTTVLCVPINFMYFSGLTNNVWGDSLATILFNNNVPMVVISFLNSLVLEIPDKTLSVVIAYKIYKRLKNKN